jgi:drug/metabolite transporter (DMT)-like permease
VVLFVASVITDQKFLPYSDRNWMLFFALGIIPTIFGHTVFNWAIKHVRAFIVSISFLAEPVIASILAFLFFGEIPGATTLIGGVMILSGIYIGTSASLSAKEEIE